MEFNPLARKNPIVHDEDSILDLSSNDPLLGSKHFEEMSKSICISFGRDGIAPQ